MAMTTQLVPLRKFLTGPFLEVDRMRREMDQMWRSFLPERPLSKGEAAIFGEWFPEFDLS